MKAQVAAFVSSQWSVPAARLQISVEPLHGGLQSAVTLARIAEDPQHPSVPTRLVVKELRPGFEREAGVYQSLWHHLKDPPAVRVLGRQTVGETTYLYLEDAASASPWPWSDVTLAAAVCHVLSRFHDRAALPSADFSWDYEQDLARSAETTLQLASAARDGDGRRYWRRLGDLRRVVRALPVFRSHLLAGGKSVIHGDVHPGNVVLRREHPDPEVVLLDWGRARVGSPLEDVASWLHSLGCWEPQARRRHDTLMRAYLDARRVRSPFAANVRADYWFASASNGLSGAIRYHLTVLGDSGSREPARYDSARALSAWQRVVRRASALVSTNHGRCT
jgi:hypothetical protein